MSLLEPAIPAEKTLLKVQETFLRLARAGYIVRVDKMGVRNNCFGTTELKM